MTCRLLPVAILAHQNHWSARLFLLQMMMMRFRCAQVLHIFHRLVSLTGCMLLQGKRESTAGKADRPQVGDRKPLKRARVAAPPELDNEVEVGMVVSADCITGTHA